MPELASIATVVSANWSVRVPILPPNKLAHAAPPGPEEAARLPMTPPVVPDTGLLDKLEQIADHIEHAFASLVHIDADLHRLLEKPDMGQVISIGQYNPVKIETFGRRYYRLLLSATASVVFDSPTGSMTLSLVAGWNAINLPDGTVMSLASGNPINVYALASDHING